MVVEKLEQVLGRRYLGPGVIKSLTAFFDVDKVKEGNKVMDIRMVYDGTISGFNDSLEVPKFGLPTLRSHLRAMEPGYFMVDADVGECFLNFILHKSLRPYVGVDLTPYISTNIEEGSSSSAKQHWVCWHRAGMGLKSSPYQTCQAMQVVEEVIRGNRHDPDNPFRWDHIRMNLPGSADYDPRLPWVSKVRMCDSLIACDVFIYVDDLRITGMIEEEAWRAAHVVGCVLAWLGIPDASRKWRDASRTAGAWAGSVVYSTPEEVFVLVTQEKWEKGKLMIHELQDCLREGPTLNRIRLQQVRGYLNYIALTYPILLTRLMGFHLTIDGWRKNWDQHG